MAAIGNLTQGHLQGRKESGGIAGRLFDEKGSWREESRAYATELEQGTADTDQRLADDARQRVSEAIGSDR